MLVETRLNPSSEVPIIRENDFQRISNNSNYKDYYHIEHQKSTQAQMELASQLMVNGKLKMEMEKLSL